MNNPNTRPQSALDRRRTSADHEAAPPFPRARPPIAPTHGARSSGFHAGNAATAQQADRESVGQCPHPELEASEANLSRAITTIGATANRFEFSFPGLDTLVLVEEWGGEILIRATRDTFSLERKECFIRALAAEGFIPEDFRWVSITGAEAASRARWLVDAHCLKSGEDLTMRRMVTGFLIAMPLLWMGWTMFLRFTGR
jgi:hypothetical protein